MHRELDVEIKVVCVQVLKYFLKSENNSEIERVGSKYHATGGPMQVERYTFYRVTRTLLNCYAELLNYVQISLAAAPRMEIDRSRSRAGLRQSSGFGGGQCNRLRCGANNEQKWGPADHRRSLSWTAQ